MTDRPPQSVDAPIASRLTPRLEALRLAAAVMTPDGRIDVLGALPEALNHLILSREFIAALTQHAAALLARGEASAAIELLPGLFAVPLLANRRPQRLGPGCTNLAVPPVVLLPTRELLSLPALRQAVAAAGDDPDRLLDDIPDSAWVEPAALPRLTAAIAALHDDAAELDRQIDQMRDLSSELSNTYEELSLLYKLSAHMTVNEAADDFFHSACSDLRRVIDVRWMALLLANTPDRLSPALAGRLYAEGQIADDFDALRILGQTLLAADPEARWPRIVENTRQSDLPTAGRDGQPLARQLLVVPLHHDDVLLGVLFAGDKNSRQPLTSVDAKLCGALAASLGIFLENLKLYDNTRDMFEGTLRALTSAIDAKDSYTHGHSQRVALMARQLAAAINLSEHQVQRIHLAGLVHDVGKIGVPEAILTKPGKLTAQEFDVIKQHPEIGAHILEGIAPMQDLLPGVLYHHERWDGRGYPHGKRGEEIPLYGRILGIADAFDAMSSNRSYRPSMPHDEVLAEVRDCAATQFDPRLAAAFLELDFEPYFQLVQRHHAADLRRSA